MKKGILNIFIVLLVNVNLCLAQQSGLIKFESGYAIPNSLKNPFKYTIGYAYKGEMITDNGVKIFQQAKNPVINLCTGMNFSLTYAHPFNNWVRFAFTIYYMNSKNLSFERNINDYFSFTNKYTAIKYISESDFITYYRWDIHYYLKQYAFFPEIDIYKKIKNIEFSLIGRYGFSINNVYYEESYCTLNDISGYSYKYYEYVSKESMSSNKFLFQLGSSIGVPISKNLNLDFSFYYRPFDITPKKGKLIYLNDLKFDYQNNVTQSHDSYDLIFTKDDKELATNKKARYPTKYKSSTYSFSIGLRYSFRKN